MDPVQHKLKVFSGNAHPALAREICAHLRVPLGEAYVGRFPDGEVRLQILENVRGADVFVIQPTCNPVNDNLMELLVMLDAMRRASAAHGEHEKRIGEADANWPDWYAQYMVAEQAGTELPT